MGGGDDHRTTAPVLEMDHVFAEGGGSARLLPEVQRLDGRQADFLAADGVHLLPQDVRDLVEAALGEGAVGVDAGGHALEHAGAQHELVAGRFGLGGGFTQGLEEELGGAHCFPGAGGGIFSERIAEGQGIGNRRGRQVWSATFAGYGTLA